MTFRPRLREAARLAFAGKTLARIILLEGFRAVLEKRKDLRTAGDVLELGWHAASHQRAYPEGWRMTGANVVAGDGVAHVFDAGEAWPLGDDTFDIVIMANTIAHVPGRARAIAEARRVARRAVIWNDYLVAGIAPHPRDYHRTTRDGIVMALGDAAPRAEIVALGGSFSSALALVDPYLRFRLVRAPLYFAALLLDRLETREAAPQQYLVILNA